MRLPSVPASLSLLLIGHLSAQTIHVVDALGRPGSNFLDLPPAVAAAAPGDTIILRSDAGRYAPFTTNKGLTIQSDFGEAFIGGTTPTPIVIANLPAGQHFMLRGCLVGPTNLSGPLIQCNSCTGDVVLQALTVGIGFPSIDVQGCNAVLVQETRIGSGYPGIRANASYLEVMNCQLGGGAADDRIGMASASAIELALSIGRVEGTSAQGGLGRGTFAPSPAVSLQNSTLDAGAIGGFGALRGGPAGVVGTGNSPAVVGTASLARFDPALVVAGSGTAPATVGITVGTLQAPGLLLDTHFRLSLFLGTRTAPTAITALAVGLPADATTLPGIGGTLWLDPNATFLTFGIGNGIVVPQLPLGFQLAAQLVAIEPTGISLSNVGFWVAR